MKHIVTSGSCFPLLTAVVSTRFNLLLCSLYNILKMLDKKINFYCRIRNETYKNTWSTRFRAIKILYKSISRWKQELLVNIANNNKEKQLIYLFL